MKERKHEKVTELKSRLDRKREKEEASEYQVTAAVAEIHSLLRHSIRGINEKQARDLLERVVEYIENVLVDGLKKAEGRKGLGIKD